MDMVERLIYFHDERPSLEPKKIRKFFAKTGLDIGPMLFQVKRADTLGQSPYRKEEKLAYIDRLEEMYEEIVNNHICVQKSDLTVNGRDLIAMGMKPGKDMGYVIDQMFEAVLQDPKLNERKKLLELANKLVAPFI
jgi:tRNA nucleotidyltransferase (CCA-adding enzyme)